MNKNRGKAFEKTENPINKSNHRSYTQADYIAFLKEKLENEHMNEEKLIISITNEPGVAILISKYHNQKENELKQIIKILITKLSVKYHDFKNSYQLVEKLFDDEESKDIFISESTSRIINECLNELDTLSNYDLYKTVENDMINKMSHSVWDKLESISKKCIISAILNYNQFENLQDYDFSSVCLSLCRAFEIELYERFSVKYIDYLEKKKIAKSLWPLILKNNPERFTIGSIGYIIGIKGEEKEKRKFHEMLLKYCIENLYKEKNIDYINKKLDELYIVSEKIRNDFRNCSAHKNSISNTTASDCINYIIYVSEALKKTIIEFNY